MYVAIKNGQLQKQQNKTAYKKIPTKKQQYLQKNNKKNIFEKYNFYYWQASLIYIILN